MGLIPWTGDKKYVTRSHAALRESASLHAPVNQHAPLLFPFCKPESFRQTWFSRCTAGGGVNASQRVGRVCTAAFSARLWLTDKSERSDAPSRRCSSAAGHGPSNTRRLHSSAGPGLQRRQGLQQLSLLILRAAPQLPAR